MADFDRLGSFYLGRPYDLGARTAQPGVVAYDAKDLTTHAVIIGMTGSGKTGLGIGLLEEALLDGIPVIAVDPKGDLGNLALRFPQLRGEDFHPWVDPQQAAASGMDPAAFAAQQAARWRDGLAGWQQDGTRIQRLADAADVTIYTPGSSAGIPLSLLGAFDAPPPALRDDPEALQERVEATTTSLLALMGLEADPVSSREHILVATILHEAWQGGRSLDLAGLIRAIQHPPMATIGVMPLDTVYPPSDRMALALRLNNLLAAPGFQSWMQGDPLDTAALLHDAQGRPRGSVLSIAHLGDAERMFFVTLLLANVIAWVRTQPGTGSLRAILYIDELFGYMPPVANPPSKRLLLTLLKQARAFGLGVVLSTQNPVDLDYRGLSNAGTWFIGRLQTERDLARVMDGLASASGGQPFDRTAMEQRITALGKRIFLLHSVHEPAPVIFETRWTMSYLAGPMTREQIRTVTAARPRSDGPRSAPVPTGSPAAAATPSMAEPAGSVPPVLPPEIPQYVAPVPPDGAATTDWLWVPTVLGVADVHLTSAKHGVAEHRRILRSTTVGSGPIPLDWSTGTPITWDPAILGTTLPDGVRVAPLPPLMTRPKSYTAWGKLLQKWLVTAEGITLYRSPTYKATSAPGETEGAFRIRLDLLAREARDAKVEALRAKYATRLATATEKVRRAEQTVARESEQASAARMESAVTMGGALLGALLGRGRITASRVGSAARGASRAAQQASDVGRARESLAAAQVQLQTLEATITAEIAALQAGMGVQHEPLEEVRVRPKAADVTVQQVALCWCPKAPTAS